MSQAAHLRLILFLSESNNTKQFLISGSSDFFLSPLDFTTIKSLGIGYGEVDQRSTVTIQSSTTFSFDNLSARFVGKDVIKLLLESPN